MIVDNSMIKKYLIFFCLVIISCRHADEFRKIREGNFEIVEKGTYHGRPQYIGQGGDYEDLVIKLRADIEKNSTLLPSITKKYFSTPYDLFYRFKFVALDKENNYLILRYFARIPEHPLYAGYQIQFVYAITTERLMHIYTSEVPLE
jgi:hypothetical protein